MSKTFPYNVFLSHGAKDKVVAGANAERLRLTRSQLSTLNHQPTGDPLNKERRFISLRLGTAPIKGSLVQRTRLRSIH